jgi:hypothetical protein
VLDKISKQNLARHLQKYSKAYHKSSALGILQEDQIQFLTTINNKAKVWQGNQSLVLGKARVMSYKELEKVQAKRAEKDAAQEAKGKGKHGYKHKSGMPEAERVTIDTVKQDQKHKSTVLEAEAEAEEPEPEPSAKMAQTSKVPALSRASAMQTPTAEDDIMPEPWRAPVAKMW